MQKKKSKKADLERWRWLFMAISFYIVLFLSIFAYEYKSYDALAVDGFGDLSLEELDEEEIEITRPWKL